MRIAGLLATFGTGCAAAMAEGAATSFDRLSDDRLRVQGVFETQLPGTEHKHSLRLVLHPHFGDLVKYDHLRTAVGLNYALSSRFEVRAEAEAYFAHGLGDVGFLSRTGFGEVRFQAKHHLGEGVLPGWDSAVGVGFQAPVNHPPRDITDGLEHRTAWVTFARPLVNRPNVRVFWGMGADFVASTAFEGRHDKNALRDSHQTLSAGLVVDRGSLHYTLETRFSTTRLLGSVDEDVIEIRPGFIWELPRGERVNRRRNWVLGMALSTKYGPDGLSFGLGARVRIDLDLKRQRNRERHAARP